MATSPSEQTLEQEPEQLTLDHETPWHEWITRLPLLPTDEETE